MFFKMFKRFLKSGPGLKKLEKMRKNRQKMRKMAAPESPNIYYCHCSCKQTIVSVFVNPHTATDQTGTKCAMYITTHVPALVPGLFALRTRSSLGRFVPGIICPCFPFHDFARDCTDQI